MTSGDASLSSTRIIGRSPCSRWSPSPPSSKRRRKPPLKFPLTHLSGSLCDACEEETCDRSVASHMAFTPPASSCQPLPLSESRAGGPRMSSAFDTEDKWRSQPPFWRIRMLPMDVWLTGWHTGIQMELLSSSSRSCPVIPKGKWMAIREPQSWRRRRHLSQLTSIN